MFLRNSRLVSKWRLVNNTKSRLEAPNNLSANKRWKASNASPLPPQAAAPATSNGQRLAGYVAASTTAAAITCYRPDFVIPYDPYNIGGTVLAVLAHNAVNPIAAGNFSWLVLIGSLAVGEFMGNGFRDLYQQYSSITVTSQQRHQLLDDVAKIAETEVTDMDKDMKDVFSNTVSTIVLVAKTRWMHLCRASKGAGAVPDHMSTEELKSAILNMQQSGEEDNDTKEALLQVLSVADINNDGIVTFMEFSRALLLLEFAKRHNVNAKSELYFRAIDLENNGTINEEELLHFAKRLHALGGIPHKDRTTPHWSGMYERPSIPEEICAKWMSRFDVNHDGLISRDEFDKMAEEIDFGQTFVFTKYFDKMT